MAAYWWLLGLMAAKKIAVYSAARFYGFPKIYRKLTKLNHKYISSHESAKDLKQPIDNTLKTMFRWPNIVYNYFHPKSTPTSTNTSTLSKIKKPKKQSSKKEKKKSDKDE